MGLDDIVRVISYKQSGRNIIKILSDPMEVIQVTTTHRFDPSSVKKTYMLEDGNWYKESEVEHSVQLSRDNKIKKLV